MKSRVSAHYFGLFGLASFLGAFFFLFNAHWPSVGHDYGFVLSRLLEGNWYFFHQGIAVVRYAVHLCGGSVFYGHPLDMYYSPVQLLSLILDPWIAIQLVICAALIVGYWGWYLFGRDVLSLPPQWSHFLALVISANGFVFMHLLAGHFTYHGFSLFGLLWWFLLSRIRRTWSQELLTALAFAMACAYVLYSGNWVVFLFFILSIPFVLFLDLIFSVRRIRRIRQILYRALLYAPLSLLICASKLVAIGSFLRYFPRTIPIDRIDPSTSIIGYFLKSFWLIPQSSSAFEGVPFMLQEKSVFLSPVVIIGIFFGLILMTKEYRHWKENKYVFMFSLLFVLLFFWSMWQISSGRGFLSDTLHALPIFASQHVATRYLYLFSLFVSTFGVWCLARLVRKWAPRWEWMMLWCSAIATVVTFFCAYYPVLNEVGLWANVQNHANLLRTFDYAEDVIQVADGSNLMGMSGINCYEPILDNAGSPQKVLHIGPVDDEQDGYFNLMNPACYQYPVANSCKPGDRIAVQDGQNLENFRRGLPVSWKISIAQYIADRLTLSALSIVLFALIIVIMRKLQRIRIRGLTIRSASSLRRSIILSFIIFLWCVLGILILQMNYFPMSMSII
ncbi:MAG: hypothetical protein WCG83_06965 [Candidatus Peregrinibacteria bacterium]